MKQQDNAEGNWLPSVFCVAEKNVSIGELVRLTGVRYSTLKYYTEDGLLPFEQSGENLTRRYRREESVERILSIKELRQKGKSIPEIREMLQGK